MSNVRFQRNLMHVCWGCRGSWLTESTCDPWIWNSDTLVQIKANMFSGGAAKVALYSLILLMIFMTRMSRFTSR